MTDLELLRQLVPHWYATRAWAERLLVDSLRLERARDVLSMEHRGRKSIAGSRWFYRTHGVGVDVTSEGNRGGIDFDFDKPDPNPWRLRLFAEKQQRAGLLPDDYHDLMSDPELFERLATLICRELAQQTDAST